MLKSYLPAKFNTYYFAGVIVGQIFGLYKIILASTFFYACIYILFRRNRNDFRNEQRDTRGVMFSPVNGKVVHLEKNVSHGIFGEGLTEIQLAIPWWKEMGIFLPFSSEVKSLIVLKGISFFRLHKAVEKLGSSDGKGLALALDNKKGDIVGLSLLKCKLGLWPEVVVVPGDRGGRQVNIGFFPFGGTVLLYLPQKYEILIKQDDEVVASETIVAVSST